MIILGDVQGVFFRAFVRREAASLGLKGYVRNLADGSVEVVAEGHEEKLNELVKLCRKGPDGATVSEIKIGKIKDQGFSSFKIIY